MKMYQEDLMDHYQHPRYRKKLEQCDFESHQVNPLLYFHNVPCLLLYGKH